MSIRAIWGSGGSAELVDDVTGVAWRTTGNGYWTSSGATVPAPDVPDEFLTAYSNAVSVPKFKVGDRAWLPGHLGESGEVVTITKIRMEPGGEPTYAIEFNQTEPHAFPDPVWPQSWFQEIQKTPLRRFIEEATSPDPGV